MPHYANGAETMAGLDQLFAAFCRTVRRHAGADTCASVPIVGGRGKAALARRMFTGGGALLCGALLAGCDPVSLTVFGVGTATGVQHTLNGITYRTFTAPLPKVRSAANASLDRMGIKVVAREKNGSGEVIKATATERTIEIELDALTPSTTRMRAMVRNGLFYDSATGLEIILQTERVLNARGAG